MPGFGRNITFGYAKETTYNGVWGTPTLIGLYTDPPEFTPNAEIIKEVHASGRPELQETDIVQGIRNCTVRVSGKIPKEGFSRLAYGLMGKVTTIGSGPWQHTCVPSVSSPPSFKLQVRTPLDATNTQWQIRGAKITAVEFSYPINGFPRFTLEFIGASFNRTSLNGAPTVPVPSDGSNPFWSYDQLTDFSPGIHSRIGWNSFVIRIENVLASDVDDSYEIGSRERIRLERAGSEECITYKVTAKKVCEASDLTALFDLFDSLTDTQNCGANLLITGEYGFNVISIRNRISSHTLTPKGLGLVEQNIETFGLGIEEFKIIITDNTADPTA